eukprot:GHVO01011683.1.p1 GENE.GHVO01011683.1~~GHVO01011683.1.p1  ORF type:complete len:1130 (-),score=220.03 GHVO01011683.1:165-3302(-)
MSQLSQEIIDVMDFTQYDNDVSLLDIKSELHTQPEGGRGYGHDDDGETDDNDKRKRTKAPLDILPMIENVTADVAMGTAASYSVSIAGILDILCAENGHMVDRSVIRTSFSVLIKSLEDIVSMTVSDTPDERHTLNLDVTLEDIYIEPQYDESKAIIKPEDDAEVPVKMTRVKRLCYPMATVIHGLNTAISRLLPKGIISDSDVYTAEMCVKRLAAAMKSITPEDLELRSPNTTDFNPETLSGSRNSIIWLLSLSVVEGVIQSTANMNMQWKISGKEDLTDLIEEEDILDSEGIHEALNTHAAIMAFAIDGLHGRDTQLKASGDRTRKKHISSLINMYTFCGPPCMSCDLALSVSIKNVKNVAGGSDGTIPGPPALLFARLSSASFMCTKYLLHYRRVVRSMPIRGSCVCLDDVDEGGDENPDRRCMSFRRGAFRILGVSLNDLDIDKDVAGPKWRKCGSRNHPIRCVDLSIVDGRDETREAFQYLPRLFGALGMIYKAVIELDRNLLWGDIQSQPKCNTQSQSMSPNEQSHLSPKDGDAIQHAPIDEQKVSEHTSPKGPKKPQTFRTIVSSANMRIRKSVGESTNDVLGTLPWKADVGIRFDLEECRRISQGLQTSYKSIMTILKKCAVLHSEGADGRSGFLDMITVLKLSALCVSQLGRAMTDSKYTETMDSDSIMNSDDTSLLHIISLLQKAGEDIEKFVTVTGSFIDSRSNAIAGYASHCSSVFTDILAFTEWCMVPLSIIRSVAYEDSKTMKAVEEAMDDRGTFLRGLLERPPVWGLKASCVCRITKLIFMAQPDINIGEEYLMRYLSPKSSDYDAPVSKGIFNTVLNTVYIPWIRQIQCAAAIWKHRDGRQVASHPSSLASPKAHDILWVQWAVACSQSVMKAVERWQATSNNDKVPLALQRTLSFLMGTMTEACSAYVSVPSSSSPSTLISLLEFKEKFESLNLLDTSSEKWKKLETTYASNVRLAAEKWEGLARFVPPEESEETLEADEDECEDDHVHVISSHETSPLNEDEEVQDVQYSNSPSRCLSRSSSATERT